MAYIKKLSLPIGWSAEPISCKAASPNTLFALIRPTPGGGIVTIDFERRIFAGGFGAPNRNLVASKKQYKGAGWKESIVQDAIKWLDSVMHESTPKIPDPVFKAERVLT